MILYDQPDYQADATRAIKRCAKLQAALEEQQVIHTAELARLDREREAIMLNWIIIGTGAFLGLAYGPVGALAGGVLFGSARSLYLLIKGR